MSLFENLTANDDQQRVANRKTVAVANKRLQDRFGAFVRAAQGEADFRSRLALVEDDVHLALADAIEEHGGDIVVESLAKTIIAGWEDLVRGPDGRWGSPAPQEEASDTIDLDSELADAPSAVGESSGDLISAPESITAGRWTLSAVDEDDDDDKKGEEDKSDSDDDSDDDDDKNLPPWLKDKESRTADAPRDGGGAVKTEKLPKGKGGDGPTGLKGPSPKIDKGNSGDERGWSLKPIDTETSGTPHPTVEQDITDEAKYDKKEFLDQTDAVTKSESLPKADDSGQSTERNIEQPSQAADQWTGTSDQADPVTHVPSSTLAAVDVEKNPIREVLENEYDGFVPETTVESAIQEFNNE